MKAKSDIVSEKVSGFNLAWLEEPDSSEDEEEKKKELEKKSEKKRGRKTNTTRGKAKGQGKGASVTDEASMQGTSDTKKRGRRNKSEHL